MNRPGRCCVLLSVSWLASVASADQLPTVRHGILSEPSERAPAVIAQEFLLAQSDRSPLGSGDLETIASRGLRDGSLVTVRQTMGGLPVLGASAAVRLDAAGRVRWSRSTLRALPAIDTRPALSFAEVLRALGYPASAQASARQRLVIAALGSAPPRLAWQLLAPPDRERHELWQLLVDAESGAVLARRNLVHRAAGHRARVQRVSPVTTPGLAEVVFEDLPVGAQELADPDVESSTCVMDPECVDNGAWGISAACSPRRIATAGSDGTFLAYAPPDDHADPTDGYAEVVAYHHVKRAYRFFRRLLGDPAFELDSEPVTVIANLRLPTRCSAPGPVPPDLTLDPFENAFFAPAGFAIFPDIAGPTVNLGQGIEVDYAYDGDVVYHELGHGLMYRLAPDFGWVLVTPHGVDVTAGGLIEGLPDYLSAVLSGDPRLGEYIGQGWDPPTSEVRNLDNDRRCPDDLAGESHADAEIVGGALWEVRSALPSDDRALMDAAVVTVIAGLGPDDALGSFSAMLRAELDTGLGAEAASAAAGILAARGLDGCADMIIDQAFDRPHALQFFSSMIGALAPGPVQFRVDLAGASAVRVRAELLPGSDVTPIPLLIKPAAPILWTDTHDAPRQVDLDGSSGAIDTVIEGPFEGEVVLQFASYSGAQVLVDTTFSPVRVDAPEPDAGPDPERSDAELGCGCSSGAKSTDLAAGLVVFVLATYMGIRRSRRRAGDSP